MRLRPWQWPHHRATGGRQPYGREADEARRRALELERRRARLPKLAAGVHLALAPADWCSRPGVPGVMYLDLRVVDVQPADRDEVAWVRGHGLECSWEAMDCRQPWCHELLVTVAALRRAAGERPC